MMYFKHFPHNLLPSFLGDLTKVCISLPCSFHIVVKEVFLLFSKEI